MLSLSFSSGNIYVQKIFAALHFISVCKCVQKWQIQLNSVGWIVVNVESRMV
jgi:hypothetical protein